MKFYDASKELPKYSCTCVTISKRGAISSLDYSAVHKKFNCSDWSEPEDVARTAIEVAYWKLEKEFLQEVEYV